MIHFFNKTVNRSGTRSVVPAVILAIVFIICLAVPFVVLVIWSTINLLGIPLTEHNAYLYIGPITTIVTVVFIFIPLVRAYRKIFAENIEERKKAQIAQKKAEDLMAQRAEFVNYVSHEIRNPLNGIIGIADAIDMNSLDPNSRQSIEIIKKSSDDLTYILNDILDMAKVDAGKLELQPSHASLRRSIRQIYDFWSPVAQDRNLALNLYICETFPDYVNIDIQRFRQVCNNLVSNAIKYSETGTILFSAECDFENMKALVSVQDTGVGIPVALHERIFEPFEQVKKLEKNRPQILGTGLGLPIARKIARMMAGDVVLAQSDQRGSKFVFSFGVEPVETPEEMQVSVSWIDSHLSNLKAIIIDQSLANSLALREQLKSFGLEAIFAGSVDDGLRLLDEGSFDFVFVDDTLKDKDLEKIRSVAKLNQNKLIAYTLKESYKNIDEVLAADFDGMISKPLSSAEVQNALVRILLRDEKNRAS